jgi:hypothetical protein
LEAFAIYFIGGLADEKIAFRPISSVYCLIMEKLMFYILEESKKNKNFFHAIQLYILWKNRLEGEKLKDDALNAQNEAEKIKKKLGETIDGSFKIEPIGTTPI